MNRRDFLKTLGLALSALVLPKVKVSKRMGRTITGTDATLELNGHSLTDCVPVTNEWLADGIPLSDCVSGDDSRLWHMYNETVEHCRLYGLEPVAKDQDAPPTLMGYPIVFREDCPDNTVFLISGDYRPQVLKNIVPPEEV